MLSADTVSVRFRHLWKYTFYANLKLCNKLCTIFSSTVLTCNVLVAWLIGNALVSINEVTLHRARLVLGWVTVCERVNHLGM